MSKIQCRVCGSNGDAPLCKACTAIMCRAIKELPTDLADLQLVASRQVVGPLGLGRGRQWDGPFAEGSLGDAPWEFAPGPADQVWALRNTVTTWARHLIETHKLDGPARRPARPLPATYRRVLTVHRNRAVLIEEVATWAEQAWPLTIADICRWLIDNVASIRRDEAAAVIYDELVGLHDENEAWIIGNVNRDEFYGTCDSPDIRFDSRHPAGPTCPGLTDCVHHSCGVIRQREPILVARASTCGVQLHGPADAATVKCQACGVEYRTADRKAKMREALPDKLGTISEVAGALTQLDAPVSVEALNSAVRRGHIPVRGLDPNRHRLVRVGDVEAYLAHQAERSEKRRKITAA